MTSLKYASFELLVFLSGFLPIAKLETSVLSICLTTTTYYIPYGIDAAVSTRVSNKLGAGNSEAAKLAVAVAVVLGVAEAVIGSTALFCKRNVLGYVYSNEKEGGGVCQKDGVARGSGWQNIGACVNLGAYYLVGIPVAALLGFVFKLRGEGLWIGIVTGTTLQAILLLLITTFTDWKKQVVAGGEGKAQRDLEDEDDEQMVEAAAHVDLAVAALEVEDQEEDDDMQMAEAVHVDPEVAAHTDLAAALVVADDVKMVVELGVLAAAAEGHTDRQVAVEAQKGLVVVEDGGGEALLLSLKLCCELILQEENDVLSAKQEQDFGYNKKSWYKIDK
ncbi:Multi antimicrobial extrusion protein [Trema orientale]|uniref:Multi antimicrobial extrusion protein n=1 Tax=Trema orientale TaxID=63057 RepID=A0A2P5B008_TREOI|nr:Multi antimicrobial extrusion protein [Trema orientale]